jgi:predicted amidohydrolase
MSLNLSIFQMDILWHKPSENLNKIETFLLKQKIETDIFILPEMFTTGFTKENTLFQQDIASTLKRLSQWSRDFKALFIGSIIYFEKGQYFNRLYAVAPDGQIFYYDKRHLFTMAKEHEYYQPGKNKIIIEYKNWKILPLICFDLIFPVWSRNEWKNNELSYDIAIYVANWPKTRIQHWNTLLKARAIENQCFVIGCNRVGTDGYNIEYNGCSAVYDFEGKTLTFNENQECILNTILSKEKLENYRKNFPAYLSADKFILDNN